MNKISILIFCFLSKTRGQPVLMIYERDMREWESKRGQPEESIHVGLGISLRDI